MDRDTADEIKRHIDVVAEETRSQIAAVVEGRTRLVERADEHDRKLEAFRQEVRKELDETRAMIRLSYGELERRIVDPRDGHGGPAHANGARRGPADLLSAIPQTP